MNFDLLFDVEIDDKKLKNYILAQVGLGIDAAEESGGLAGEHGAQNHVDFSRLRNRIGSGNGAIEGGRSRRHDCRVV